MAIKKVLAVDYGKKRLGLAVGDLLNKIAVPVGIIENKGLDFVVQKISEFCKEREIVQVILGYPLHMQSYGGGETKLAKEVKLLSEELQQKLSQEVEISFIDERLSSFEAEELLESVQKDSKFSKHDDDLAAAVILQRFFDSLK